MFVKRSLLLIVVTVLSVLAATGQTPATPPNKTGASEQKKEEAQAKLDAQAYELLDAVIKDIQRLRLAQNRATLCVTVGELIWHRDEQAARALFKDAVANLLAFLSEPLETGSPTSNRQRMERGQLREKVLFALARHDTRMALDLFAETRPLAPPDDEAPRDSEAELETRLAAVIAANDPAHALEMARKSLAKGLSSNLPSLLSEIQGKDPVAAAELAGDILTKLKTASLATNPEAANVAVRIFEMATVQTPPSAKTTTKEVKPLLTEQSLRELAELIATAALEASSDKGARPLNVESVMTQLDKYAPSRAQQLRRKNVQSEGEIVGEYQSYQILQKLLETGTADELIAAAEKAEPGLRESYYRGAALKLVNDDKIDEARKIITEHISDPEQRKLLLAELDKQVLSAAASKGKLEETRKLISAASTNEERIAILTQLAMAVAEKGDKKTALQILEEARNLSPGRARYSRQLFARFQIARAYAWVEPAQCFAILETSIDQLNELIGAGIILGEFFGEEEFVRDDEILMTFVGGLTDLFERNSLKDLAQLTTADFARTRDAADRFQRFEVRIVARLLVVQSVLMPKEDDSDKPSKDASNAKPSPPPLSTDPTVVP